MRARTLRFVVGVLFLLAACGPAIGLPQKGQGEPRAAVSPTDTRSPADGGGPAGHGRGEGVVLVYERSGGLAGITQVFEVHADGRVILTSDHETDGMTAKVDPESVKALVLAIERAGFFDLQESYLPEDLCCDRMTHRIVVYRDGQAKSVTTIDGYEGTPDALNQILEALGRFLQEAVAGSR
jgi:hypothetical protein